MPISPIVMPKWGLAMQEGTLAKWAVSEGAALKAGQEIADIETSKIAERQHIPVEFLEQILQIGRASCRDRV